MEEKLRNTIAAIEGTIEITAAFVVVYNISLHTVPRKHNDRKILVYISRKKQFLWC